MTQLNGYFSLRSSRDLVRKLEHDYKRLASADPSTVEAQYAAYDFFVSAEHMADWVKSERGESLTSLKAYPDGALVSHIANGVKHFHVTDPRHKSVRDTAVARAFQANAFSPAFQRATLMIELEAGGLVPVVEVAARVLDHWKAFV